MAVLSLNSQPVGYRFSPTDQELVDYYLRLKINGNNKDVRVIRELDVCKWEPWDLPDLSAIETTDHEWFFFCPRDRKYPKGQRSNRATGAGYWKATGKDRTIRYRKKDIIGMKKTLVFYRGRAPSGRRTHWIIHEYRTTLKELDGTHPGQEDFVICRLFKKQEDNSDGSNCDEVELADLSPTTPKSSPEVIRSELVLVDETPVLGGPVEGKLACIDSCPALDSEKTASDTTLDAACPINSYNAYDSKDQTLEVTSTEEDLQLEEDMKMLYDPADPPDCKLFSPPYSHMHAELGASYMYANEFRNYVHFQYGTNEQEDDLDFLNSLLTNVDGFSCQGSPCQNNSLEIETVNYGGVNSIFIKEEADMAQTQMRAVGGVHETLHYENNPNDSHSQAGFASDPPYGMYNISSIEETRGPANAVGSSHSVETGILVRTRQLQNQPIPSSHITQGSASRRVRLGIVRSRAPDCGSNPTVVEARETVKKPIAVIVTKVEPQEINFPESNKNKEVIEVSKNVTVMRRIKQNNVATNDGVVTSAWSRAGGRRSFWPSVNLLRVVMFAALFIIVLGVSVWLVC